jgi:hypothetical protein
MNAMAGSEPPWANGRHGADAENVHLDALYQALRHSGPHDPRPVTFTTDASLLTEEGPGRGATQEIEIQIFITALRVVMQPDYEYPEWEFEGWLKDDQLERTWLRGVLRVITYDDDEVECTLYRLTPGEEWGDRPTPGMS